jgi:hypothetical protein
MDILIGHFKEKTQVPWHLDMMKSPSNTFSRVIRINLILWNAKKGGEFEWIPESGKPILDWPRLKIFDATNICHRVTEIKEGARVVLSIGIFLKEKKNKCMD